MSQLIDFRLQFTSKIISCLEQDVLPWRLAAKQTYGLPTNIVTRIPYSGVNILILLERMKELGFTANQWATYRQVKEAGGQVRKGEAGTPLIFFKKLDPLETVDKDSGTKLVINRFTVFNIAQCDGISAMAHEAEIDADAFEEVNNMLRLCDAKTDCNCWDFGYDEVSNTISLPQSSNVSVLKFLSHTLCQIVKWAVHKTIPTPADECLTEISTDIALSLFCTKLGLSVEHSYSINDWVARLKVDKNLIFSAAALAQKVVGLLMSLKTTDEIFAMLPKLPHLESNVSYH